MIHMLLSVSGISTSFDFIFHLTSSKQSSFSCSLARLRQSFLFLTRRVSALACAGAGLGPTEAQLFLPNRRKHPAIFVFRYAGSLPGLCLITDMFLLYQYHGEPLTTIGTAMIFNISLCVNKILLAPTLSANKKLLAPTPCAKKRLLSPTSAQKENYWYY